MQKILLCLDDGVLSAADRDRIQEILPDRELVVTLDPDRIANVLPDVEIAGGWFPREKLFEAPNLKWMQQWWAGADWTLSHPELADMDLVITSGSGIHGIQITEHIFAFLFAFARGFAAAHKTQLKGTWGKADRSELFELYEKTLAVIGVGAIGSRTAEVGKALGMRILGVRRNPERTLESVDEMYGPDQLHEVLPHADFVAVTTPLTVETRRMFGPEELARMKDSAYLINVGRGAVIDESALADALRAGRIAGAGLDAFETEPLPADSPLWKLDNVLITCHYSGLSPRYEERAMALFLENLQRYAAGEELKNIVDPTIGY